LVENLISPHWLLHVVPRNRQKASAVTGENMRRAMADLYVDRSDLYSVPQTFSTHETEQALPWSTTPELFEGLLHSESLRILSTGRRTEISSSGVIFRAGDPNMIFLLIDGRAKVTQVTEGGGEVVLWLNTPGQIIGSLNSASRTYSSTARALQTCKVLRWNWSTFRDNMDRFPELLRNVMRIGARQMDDLARRICEVSTEKAMPRLARGLIRLSEQIGRSANGCFEIDLTQEALAQITALNHYSVNRQLSEWERQNLVICHRNTVVIRDLQGLKRVCGAVV
jgi:CRP-like cAMP-binding protein